MHLHTGVHICVSVGGSTSGCTRICMPVCVCAELGTGALAYVQRCDISWGSGTLGWGRASRPYSASLQVHATSSFVRIVPSQVLIMGEHKHDKGVSGLARYVYVSTHTSVRGPCVRPVCNASEHLITPCHVGWVRGVCLWVHHTGVVPGVAHTDRCTCAPGSGLCYVCDLVTPCVVCSCTRVGLCISALAYSRTGRFTWTVGTRQAWLLWVTSTRRLPSLFGLTRWAPSQCWSCRAFTHMHRGVHLHDMTSLGGGCEVRHRSRPRRMGRAHMGRIHSPWPPFVCAHAVAHNRCGSAQVDAGVAAACGMSCTYVRSCVRAGGSWAVRQSRSLGLLSCGSSSCGLVTPCHMGLVCGGPCPRGGLMCPYM